MCSHFSGQLNLNEQVEKARAFHTVKLLQDGILNPAEEDFTTGPKHHRPTSSMDYALDMDYTASKVIFSVIEKCTVFQCVSALYKEGCQELLTMLEELHNILLVVQVCSSPLPTLGISNASYGLNAHEPSCKVPSDPQR